MSSKSITEASLEQEFLSNTLPTSFVQQEVVSTKGIIAKLQEHGLSIASVEPISYAMQIRLTCGAIVNVFNSGKVVVQGTVAKQARMSTLAQLQKALPATTSCAL